MAVAGPDVGGQIVDGLAQNGPLGLAVLALGWLAYKLITRETARADRAEAALAQLNKELRDDVIPAMVAATHASADATQAVRDATAILRERR